MLLHTESEWLPIPATERPCHDEVDSDFGCGETDQVSDCESEGSQSQLASARERGVFRWRSLNDCVANCSEQSECSSSASSHEGGGSPLGRQAGAFSWSWAPEAPSEDEDDASSSWTRAPQDRPHLLQEALAARAIQSWWRGVHRRRSDGSEPAQRLRAAIRLQRAWRHRKRVEAAGSDVLCSSAQHRGQGMPQAAAELVGSLQASCRHDADRMGTSVNEACNVSDPGLASRLGSAIETPPPARLASRRSSLRLVRGAVGRGQATFPAQAGLGLSRVLGARSRLPCRGAAQICSGAPALPGFPPPRASAAHTPSSPQAQSQSFRQLLRSGSAALPPATRSLANVAPAPASRAVELTPAVSQEEVDLLLQSLAGQGLLSCSPCASGGGTDEFEAVARTLAASLPDGAAVRSVARVECSPSAAAAYAAVLSSLGPERLLWHGTSWESVPNIVRHGFNRAYSFRGRHGAKLGKGSYFAEEGLLEPPVDAAGARYDSTVDSVAAPKVFCTFRDFQALPLYLVEIF